jgi:hypothetical protein
MNCRTEQTYLDILEMCGAEEENAPRPDDNRNRWHTGLSQIATQRASLTIDFVGNASWCWSGNSRDLSDVKGEPDPKRGALVDGTLHCDGPAMFLNNAFHDREA